MPKQKRSPPEGVFGMLAHTELASVDPTATKNFLAKIFRWEFRPVKLPTGAQFRYETPGGARGSIRTTQPAELPAVVNYILVEDLEKTAREIEKAGGEIVLPMVEVPGMGRFFWFKVPGGPILACWMEAPGRN